MDLKVVVPTSLGEITLEQYQRFTRLEGDDYFLTLKMLEIFCNVPIDKLPNVKFKSVSPVVQRLHQMFKVKTPLKQEFVLEGKTFGFIPDLEDIPLSEYVDLDIYLGSDVDLHKMMAVLYRPITERAGKRYSIEKYEGSAKYSELMKQVPLDVVLGAKLFFWSLGSDLLLAMTNYLEKQKTTTQLSRSSEENGDGTIPSITSLKETLLSLRMLANWEYTNASPFSRLIRSEQILNESN